MRWPAPTGPAWLMFPAKQASSGLHSANNAASPPTSRFSRPSAASLGRAGHGRVEEASALVGHRLRDLLGGRGDRGGAVDDDGAGAQALEHAARRQQHGLDLRAARDAQDDHVGTRRQRGAVGAAGRARGLQCVQGLVPRMLKHRQFVAMLDQIARDAMAHEADSNHADFRHLPLLLPFIGCLLWRRSYSQRRGLRAGTVRPAAGARRLADGPRGMRQRVGTACAGRVRDKAWPARSPCCAGAWRRAPAAGLPASRGGPVR